MKPCQLCIRFGIGPNQWVLRYIKVAELLALCGIKHFELDPSHWRWKGYSIVYRRDRVFDE